MGAAAGKVLHHKAGNKLVESAEQTIPIGGAGLIVAYPHKPPQRSSPR